MKFNSFWDGLKLENALMATLPPIHEMDARLHEELLNMIASKTQADADFSHEVLPQHSDNIEIAGYETKSGDKDVFSVPETESDNVL